MLRLQVEQLRSTGVSYMPEWLEKQIDLPAMADLLAFNSAYVFLAQIVERGFRGSVCGNSSRGRSCFAETGDSVD